MKKSLVLLATLLSVGVAFCGEKVNCEDPQGGYEQSECANRKFKVADKALNEAFKRLKSQLGKEQVKLLVAAQKGWLQLRDNQCALEVFATRGTTGNKAEYTECLEGMTELRTKQLDSTPIDSIAR